VFSALHLQSGADRPFSTSWRKKFFAGRPCETRWPIMTTEIAQFMRKLERVWDEHVDELIKRRDVDAAMAAMTAEPSVRHLPTMTGADGRVALDRFYRDALLAHLPGELQWTRRSRTVDRFRLVDELTVSFVHDCELAWLLPGLAPTGRQASVTAIAIVDFRRGAIAAQRTLWDCASLASQLGVTIDL
jgi:carboxymethylenebutenolidase